MQLQINGLGRASLLWSRPCRGCPNTCPNYVFFLLLVWPLVRGRLITLLWKLGVKQCPLNPDNSKGLAAQRPKNIKLLWFTAKGIIRVRHDPSPMLVVCRGQAWTVPCRRAIRIRGDINVGSGETLTNKIIWHIRCQIIDTNGEVKHSTFRLCTQSSVNCHRRNWSLQLLAIKLYMRSLGACVCLNVTQTIHRHRRFFLLLPNSELLEVASLESL